MVWLIIKSTPPHTHTQTRRTCHSCQSSFSRDMTTCNRIWCGSVRTCVGTLTDSEKEQRHSFLFDSCNFVYIRRCRVISLWNIWGFLKTAAFFLKHPLTQNFGYSPMYILYNLFRATTLICHPKSSHFFQKCNTLAAFFH